METWTEVPEAQGMELITAVLCDIGQTFLVPGWGCATRAGDSGSRGCRAVSARQPDERLQLGKGGWNAGGEGRTSFPAPSGTGTWAGKVPQSPLRSVS